jgi:trehalose/maltose hydrolase-like predicted phosphorylase
VRRGWVVGVVVAAGAAMGVASAQAAQSQRGHGYLLTATNPHLKGFAPAFIGNGFLAGRQPVEGQGFDRVPLKGADEPLATQSEVQGFYAKTTKSDEGLIERRAALPAWSTLDYDDGSGRFDVDRGKVSKYQQTLNLADGTLTTRLTWTSPGHKTADLAYTVATDRVHKHAAFTRLRVTPHFTGTFTVTDVIDGHAAEYATATRRGHGDHAATQFVDLRTRGLRVPATVATRLTGPGTAPPVPVTQAESRSAAQRITLHATSRKTYTFTKYVGVGVASHAHTTAVAAARDEARRGFARSQAASARAWRALWGGAIDVAGDPVLQRQVRAAQFALFASVRADTPWAPSPGGLSSDGYNGHVFWDSETWMYPSLLATSPQTARAMLRYRADRLRAAKAYAKQTGFRGARFPWESALTGSEETPSCCDTGKYEVHVSADIALALWQYWEATGDRAFLAHDGYPTASAIADYWVSRSHPNPDGTRSINGVIPPDEYHEQVDDSVYTNTAARDALRIATDIANLTGHRADPRWNQVAQQLRQPFDTISNVHPEFAGYTGDTVKQADVTLLSYPWENPQPAAVTQADLDHYVPRTDPDGPSMTDAIHSILTSQLNTPGCAAYSFTKRSVDPFMRPPYEQFSEARTGGAFTFTTGAGGFLQEFLYGYSGWRWRADRIDVDPSLPPQLTSITLNAIRWHGRRIKVAIARDATTITLAHGRPITLETPGGATRTLTHIDPVTIPTRKPDAAPTSDLARCQTATATPSTAEPPQAAVDGTPTTAWTAEKPGVHLDIDLGAARALHHVTIATPPVQVVPTGKTGPHDHPATRPTQSAQSTIAVSSDGTAFRPFAPGATARYVRVTAGADASARKPLVVGEVDAG